MYSCHLAAHLGLIILLGSIQLSNVRALYPTFENIFERHIKDAKFDGVPMKGRDFRDLKLGVVSLWHLEGDDKHMSPERRSALIQALVEHYFQ